MIKDFSRNYFLSNNCYSRIIFLKLKICHVIIFLASKELDELEQQLTDLNLIVMQQVIYEWVLNQWPLFSFYSKLHLIRTVNPENS